MIPLTLQNLNIITTQRRSGFDWNSKIEAIFPKLYSATVKINVRGKSYIDILMNLQTYKSKFIYVFKMSKNDTYSSRIDRNGYQMIDCCLQHFSLLSFNVETNFAHMRTDFRKGPFPIKNLTKLDFQNPPIEWF